LFVERILALVAARSFPAYAALVGTYLLFRAGSFTNIPGRLTDTPTYERVTHLALWDWHFYAGERGFTVPLFFKIFTTSESRALAQLVFSMAAWLVLAAAVARCFETTWLRPVAFAAVLAFSLTTEVILWDTLILSESLTFSLGALLLAAWIKLIRAPQRLWAGAALVLSTLWAFARDTNAYVLLMVALLVALTLFRPDHRRLKLTLVAGCCAIFLLGYASADVGRRWLQPMRDVVAHRVLPNPGLRGYFVARGLDVGGNWPQSTWMTERSRGVYGRYLLSHPGYALAQPFRGHQDAPSSSPANASSLLDPAIGPYNDNAGHRFLPLPRLLERALFPRGVAALCALLAAVIAGVAIVTRLRGAAFIWLVPIGVLVTTYPHLLVVWHQSGIEVDRHALEAALLLRLGILLQLALLADRLVSRHRQPDHVAT
jgi:hypothetical protein